MKDIFRSYIVKNNVNTILTTEGLGKKTELRSNTNLVVFNDSKKERHDCSSNLL